MINYFWGHIIYYLEYGSNLNLSEMKEKCPFYRVIGRMFLYNYMLSFKGEETGFLTKYLLEPTIKSAFWIFLYCISSIPKIIIIIKV